MTRCFSAIIQLLLPLYTCILGEQPNHFNNNQICTTTIIIVILVYLNGGKKQWEKTEQFLNIFFWF